MQIMDVCKYGATQRMGVEKCGVLWTTGSYENHLKLRPEKILTW